MASATPLGETEIRKVVATAERLQTVSVSMVVRAHIGAVYNAVRVVALGAD